MSFLCIGLSLADLASCAGPVASGENRGPLDLVPWPTASLCARVGKRCSGLMPIICPTRRQRRSIALAVLLGAQHLPAMFSCRGRDSPKHGWVRRHPLGHHDAGLHRHPGTHRGRVSRPAPSRRTDTRQDHPHCLTTKQSRGHTCPRRTALTVSVSTTDLDPALDCRSPYAGPPVPARVRVGGPAKPRCVARVKDPGPDRPLTPMVIDTFTCTTTPPPTPRQPATEDRPAATGAEPSSR